LIHRLIIFIIFVAWISVSCRYEEEIITDNPGFSLHFSEDTISFDTVFVSLGSITKRLTVTNPNKNAINLSKIYVGKGVQSEFEITVAGIEQNEVYNQIILGNDSLLILVKVTINPNQENLPFVVKDSIIFLYNDKIQDIKLRSWGQNARFLGDSILTENQIWTSEIPYFLTASILVDSLKTLTILEGARIYLSPNAAVFVQGTLHVKGSMDDRVLFRNERLEERYENVPGQWGGIYFLEGSKSNVIDFTDIRNAQYGLRIGTPDNDTIPDVVIRNTRIENTSLGGIVAFTSDLLMENTLVNSSTGFILANLAGGNYYYNHCTMANYASIFYRQDPSVAFSNILVLDDNSLIDEIINVTFNNSIIWGDFDEEIIINDEGESNFLITNSNSIFKTSLTIFEGDNTFLNRNTDFMKFADIESYDYTPDSLSPAIDNALTSDFIIDLFGQPRDSLPDIGAIEF